MSHGLDSCIPLLRRWSAHTDAPLPTDWNSFRQTNLAEALRLTEVDPELVSLLNGTAGAALRADALQGSINAAPPTAEQLRDEAMSAQIDALMASNPWGTPGRYEGDQYIPPTEGNMTAQFQLAALAPEIAEKMQKVSAPAAVDPAALFALRQQEEQQMAQNRVVSLQAAGLGRFIPEGV